VATLSGTTGNDSLTPANSGSNVLLGLSGDDTLTGRTGIDTIFGSSGADIVDGTSGTDILFGGDGDDRLIGVTGSDSLFGGLGFDIADYSSGRFPVSISTLSGTAIIIGGGGVDTISGIEGFIGTIRDDDFLLGPEDNYVQASDGEDFINAGAGTDTFDVSPFSFADVDLQFSSALVQGRFGLELSTILGFEVVIGSEGSNDIRGAGSEDVFFGGSGADSLNGRSGNDTLFGGSGADELVGGTGSDTAAYRSSTAAVTVDLGAGTASGGEAVGDTFSSVENLIGSSGNDILTGSVDANSLEGGSGDDSLFGGSGTDSAVFSGFRADYEIVDNGGDSYTVTDRNPNDGDEGTDSLTAIENAVFAGGSFDLSEVGIDVTYTRTGVYQGGTTRDFLTGEVFPLLGLAGSSGSFVGTSGYDRLVLESGFDYLANDLDIGYAIFYDRAAGSGTDGLQINSIEEITLTQADDILDFSARPGRDPYDGSKTGLIDPISGQTFDVSISMGDGDDVFIGGASDESVGGNSGTDVLFGNSGTDILQGGTGGDSLNGGSGTDSASYDEEGAGVTVDLSSGVHGGNAAGDTLIAIENLIGSSFIDVLTGDSGANALWGGSGNDTLSSNSGADSLNGHAGDDSLAGGSGGDLFVFGGTQAQNGDANVINDLDFAEGDSVILGFDSSDASQTVTVTSGQDLLDAASANSEISLQATGGDTLVTVDAGGGVTYSVLIEDLTV